MKHDQAGHRLTPADYDGILARVRAARTEAIAGFGRGIANWLARSVRRILRGTDSEQAERVGMPARR